MNLRRTFAWLVVLGLAWLPVVAGFWLQMKWDMRGEYAQLPFLGIGGIVLAFSMVGFALRYESSLPAEVADKTEEP